MKESEFMNENKSKLKKNYLSTCRKMMVLSALNSEVRKHLQDDTEFEIANKNDVSDHGKEVMSFLQQEQLYINCLKDLYQFFLHPMLRGSIISLDNIIKLVSEMMSLHENLYDVIISGKSTFGDALRHLSSHLEVYIAYSGLIDVNLNSLEKFAEFYGSGVITFHQLLYEPVTQISRYRIVLQNLCSSAPEKNYRGYFLAIEQTDEEIKHLSSFRKNIVRTLQIQRLLIKRQPKILCPGRIVLKEGYLYKVNCEGTGLKNRAFFLFTDILLCCKATDKSSSLTKKDSLKCCALFPLSMCSVNFVMGTSVNNGALFKITCGKVYYLLLCKTPGDAQSWVEEIQRAICMCQEPSSDVKPKPNLKRNVCIKRHYSPFQKIAQSKAGNFPAVSQENVLIENLNASLQQTHYFSIRKFMKLLSCVKRSP